MSSLATLSQSIPPFALPPGPLGAVLQIGEKLSGMTFEETRQAYEERSDFYISAFPSISATDPVDRDLIQAWAIAQTGPILDVGCGPGHWTGWLHDQGLEIEGIDPVPAFIDRARLKHPQVRFRLGRAEALGVETSSLAGILAWFSLIHIDPEQLGETFSEFARALRPGGGLCVGFFAGPALAEFDHPVSKAYFWPVSRLEDVIERAGFSVTSTQLRQEPGVQNHAATLAVRNP
ncbi:MAG TPA: class I SAM-dependent methyltransferase [Microthrixaceae bacterium]|nr:class I SAM-dependent methyltransferase [Microthrixaceae bacterium]